MGLNCTGVQLNEGSVKSGSVEQGSVTCSPFAFNHSFLSNVLKGRW